MASRENPRIANIKTEIEIGSFSFGATQSGSFSAMGGGGSGKVSMQDFHFTIPTQKASPKLLLNCATGNHIPKGDPGLSESWKRATGISEIYLH